MVFGLRAGATGQAHELDGCRTNRCELVENAVTITHFNMEITRLCNQRCVYCFNDSGPVPSPGDLSLDGWTAFLERQRVLGLQSVHFTGGEPFVDGRTIELIGIAQQLGLSTSVLSNGYRIPELAGTFSKQFRQLSVAQISLDSVHARLHDARRGKTGAWRQALSAIRTLRRIGVKCEISCTVSAENIADLERLAAFCDRLGFRLIIRPMIALGRGSATALTPAPTGLLAEAIASIEVAHPGVIVRDRFWYVPDGSDFEARAHARGIATVLRDGSFRGGPVLFSHVGRAFASVLDFLKGARPTELEGCPA
jgi:MoaA/NifB/PqqE/SkfB family radical SAM enzyme